MACLWTLVWCHERCHKADSSQERTALADAAAASGGRLICLRKAWQFADWAQRRPRPASALLIYWRELKPCLRALQSLAQSSWPQVVVVACEGKEANRARRFLQERQLQLTIHVREELGVADIPGLVCEMSTLALSAGGATQNGTGEYGQHLEQLLRDAEPDHYED